MSAWTDELQILSLVPGRVRLHLPCWTADDAEWVKNHLRRIHGVGSVHANPLTENVLIHFDDLSINEGTLLTKVNELLGKMPNGRRRESVGQVGGNQQSHEGCSPFRVVARGLLGHAVVDSLWFGAGYLGSAVGLPLAGLGPLHLLMDLTVWTLALTGEQTRATGPSKLQQAGPSRRPVGQSVCTA